MTIAPVRREILVDAGPERAFELFTGHIGAWWPLAALSVFGDGTVAFEGNEIVERSAERTSVWAEVTEWDPPSALRLNWHPGSSQELATDVLVTFSASGDRTMVRIEHSRWESRPDPAVAAAEYGNGWPGVLAALADFAGAAVDQPTDSDSGEPADQWFALVHRPGPALADGESIFANPAFPEHLAFLDRLLDRGLLVAAGPLADENGTGMTIIRVRPEQGPIDVPRLATTDDKCVAGGFLTVSVRPWQVMVAAE